ncbi:hypothetical protein Tco_0487304 [Tanacetum coccineum]
MEYLVKDSKRRAFWSLNEDIFKITILETNTPYPSRRIRHIRACTHYRPQRNEDQYTETATYGKIWYDEDIYDLKSVETEFPAIVLNDALTFEVTLSCEPTVSPLNDNKIEFRISFDESDDEDYTVSIRHILGNGYGVSTSCTVLGPRERNIDEYWWRIYKSRDLEVLES